MNDQYLIFQALIETFIKYLRPTFFLDSFSKQHTYSGVNRFEELLVKICENDTAILEFAQVLSQAAENSEIKKHILPDANKDDLFESFYVEYLPLLIDGTLTKDLTHHDYLYIAKELNGKKLILNKNYEICKSQTNRDDCQREIFKSIKRGKPHWPFVFIETIKQKRPDIFKIHFDIFQNNSMVTVLHNEINYPESCSFVSVSNTSTTDDLGESSDSILTSECYFFEDFISDQEEDTSHTNWNSDTGISNLECIFESGAMNFNDSTKPLDNFVNSEINHQGRSKFSDEEDSTNSEDEDDCISVESESSFEETLPLNLRKYQEELAGKALSPNLNTIICAPTGSGKTKVALHIMLIHLNSDDGEKKKKVAFLAKTVPLVIQQFKCIENHLPKQYKARFLIGGCEGSTSLHMILPDVDVIVMTPKILENHVKKGYVSLNNFTLLVFDECHHTCRGDPYNNIMLEYLKIKHAPKLMTQLPQVIGLTASIGIGKAENVEAAVKNIMKVCGNLDAVCMSVVEENEEELMELVPVPVEMAFQLVDHEQDQFVRHFISFFIDLEMKITEYCKELQSKWLEKHMSSLNNNLKRSSQLYGQWAVTIRNIVKILPRSHDEKKRLTVRCIIIIAEFLIAYNNALEVHNLIHLRNAMEYLDKRLEKYLKNDKPTSVERDCFKAFNMLKKWVKKQPPEENPNLLNLKQTLLEYLRKFKATVFTGSSAPTEKGGISQETQKNIIKKFKKGDIKLLVATSVAEEGLDIPECNIVIKYNHIGNEVSSLQIRGRCRKPGGVSILLAANTIYEKEMLNIEKTKLMSDAIKEIAHKDIKTMDGENEQYQREVLEKENQKEADHPDKRNTVKKRFKMICHLCAKLEICSDDKRTINGSHRVIVNQKIWSMVQVRRTETVKTFGKAQLVGTVHCKSDPENETYCFNKLGSLMLYRESLFVTLGIENFSVYVAESKNGQVFFKKWKNVPYVIEDITQEDIKRYLSDKKCNEVSSDSESDVDNVNDETQN
ncbi:hypothetical protein Btru_026248 [Bulinus truncatus]|nr:hypothetical protein Btru_026248 [Bulinus truncatus]